MWTATNLASQTTLRVGGPAKRFVEVCDETELIDLITECDVRDEPVLLLGGGSNVVIGDEGFDGTVASIKTTGVQVIGTEDEHVLVTVAAGENWDRLVARAVGDGWTGIETLSGIPGSVGATPIQNVGAYGSEVAEVIESVTVFDRWSGGVLTLGAAECGFEYRNSKFKVLRDRWVILSVTLRLRVGKNAAPIRYADLAARMGLDVGDIATASQIRRAVLEVRRTKGMVLNIDDYDTWSVGSFFTNPIVAPKAAKKLPKSAPRWPTEDDHVKLSAAWLIENAGFSKGWPDQSSPARLSTKHTLAITNRGAAKAADVLALARSVHDGVADKFGVSLQPEPVLVNCQI